MGLNEVSLKVLTELSNEVNALLGFHKVTPWINYGPCGVFAYLFFQAWNARFPDEPVHIVFILTQDRQECDHVAVRLPNGQVI